ncbi:MAG: hypothetical protein Q8N51_00990 [Gammaproteobacteria bacterium]|nr:hypothetical protein [Gammaproteobacteria bacterium]
MDAWDAESWAAFVAEAVEATAAAETALNEWRSAGGPNVRGIFGRLNDNGTVRVLYTASGEAVTRLDADVYPVDSTVSARYEHPTGVVLTRADAGRIGLVIEV